MARRQRKENIVKELLSIGGFCLLMMAILFVISPIFVPKWTTGDDNHNTQIVRGFYAERPNSLDVLFLGNSDMYRGVIPIELWDEYGVASYAYTSPGQRIWTGYYTMLDALQYQHPKVIVFNVDGINKENLSSDGINHKSFDNMKMSAAKLQALNDDAFEFSLSKKLSYIFPVLAFHSRWTELDSDDLKYAYGYEVFSEKGYDMIAGAEAYEGGASYMDDMGESYEIPEKARRYLDKIVELARSKNIELVFVENPSADSWSLAKSEAMQKYATEKDVEFVDLNLRLNEIGLDWTEDTPDGGDHLNYAGAHKVTSFYGNYLHQNFDLPDRRKDAKYASWYRASEDYREDKEVLVRASLPAYITW